MSDEAPSIERDIAALPVFAFVVLTSFALTVSFGVFIGWLMWGKH